MIKNILLWKAGSSLKRVWMTAFHLKPSPSASTKTALRSHRKSATTSTLKKQALTDVLLMIACTGKDAPGPVSALSVSKNRNVPHDAVSAEGAHPGAPTTKRKSAAVHKSLPMSATAVWTGAGVLLKRPFIVQPMRIRNTGPSSPRQDPVRMSRRRNLLR